MEEVDTTSNISSLADIPPYLKDQYSPLTEVFQAHTATLPSDRAPESNSDAVIRSLKALQEKIRTLEVERVAASERFKTLSQDVATTLPRVATTSVGTGTDSITSPDFVHKDMTTPQPREDWRSRRGGPSCSSDEDTAGLKARLDSLDKRLSQQAQELDTMHQKLRLSDAHSPHSPHTTHSPHTPHSVSLQPPVCTKSDCQCSLAEQKLRSLEKGVYRLKEVQNKTKAKVDELETCIKRSSPRRGGSHDTLDNNNNPPSGKKRTRPKPKRTKVMAGQRSRVQNTHLCDGDGLDLKCIPKPTPGIHYRADMRHLPFILGSSTTPSHSVCANYQQVLSLMKTHNHVLCGAAALRGKKGACRGNTREKEAPEAELAALLEGLEEEYGSLTLQYQTLTQHMKDDSVTQKPRVRASLELQLRQLEEQLEAKSKQLSIVSRQLSSERRSAREEPKTVVHREEISSPTQTQLCFLKKMKSLQSTLQRDDLNWK